MNGFNRQSAIPFAVLLCVTCICKIAVADLSSSSGSFTSAVGLTGVTSSVTTTSSGVPYSHSHFAALGEPPTFSASATDYNFSVLEQWTTFNFYFTHDRDASTNSSAQSSGTLNFTLDNAGPMFFSLDGFYGLSGGDGILLQVLLMDVTASSVLFSNTQESRNTVDQNFLLGNMDGDHANSLAGGLSGSLAAGHTYSLMYFYGINNPTASREASAGGFLSLQFRPAAVPAPSALLLGVMGLLSLSARRRRMG